MTADQIRRSRGSYASVRELPPEQPSIWKYWNGYSALGCFTAIMLTKEYYITGGHDMFEAILLWSFFGTIGAVASDWFAWWHTLVTQESYDREYFPLLKRKCSLKNYLKEKRERYKRKKYREER